MRRATGRALPARVSRCNAWPAVPDVGRCYDQLSDVHLRFLDRICHYRSSIATATTPQHIYSEPLVLQSIIVTQNSDHKKPIRDTSGDGILAPFVPGDKLRMSTWRAGGLDEAQH